MNVLVGFGQLLVLMGVVTSLAVMVSACLWLVVTLLHVALPSRPRELV